VGGAPATNVSSQHSIASESGFGARPVRGGVRFRVWAPAARELTLVIHDGAAAGTHRPPKDDEGVFDLIVDGAAPGDRYSYRVNDGTPRPDPASRFQPDGVHGPSQVVAPLAFEWTDGHWRRRPARDLIVYELHVGTFSPEGTFAGAASRLGALRDLGVTAVELMPVAEFAGTRNWGYDGVCPYAPSHAYGQPDDLRRFVDKAHGIAIAVVLDVVYNHLGPEGAYLKEFNPQFFTDRHATPWGGAVNLDGPGSAMVRRFINDNALHWIREYHVDGLRLDATHTLVEKDPGATLRELAQTVATASGRRVFLHAEDHRNLAAMVEDPARDGWGLDGVWADDFHHVMRRLLAGDCHGYFADFEGTTSELARTIQQGWLFTGQPSARLGRGRGTDASRVPMRRFVVCLQNHDQVGNRATGDRLHERVAPEAWRAASAVLLTVPMTPLVFMGQEWAAATPFQYFTDLEPGFGALVTEGRRREFTDFPEFSGRLASVRVPDPQAGATFTASRLRWEERDEPRHRTSLALYRALIRLRLDNRALGASDETSADAAAPDPDTLVMRRADGDDDVFWVVARLRGSGTVNLGTLAEAADPGAGWHVVLTTEEPLFALDPMPPLIDERAGPSIRFHRPGAVILKKK
jgi:maltooligosyltrehalose trehalohydrolase